MKKLIENFEHHFITPNGIVENTKTGKIRIPWVGKNGYKCVDIWEFNKGTKKYIHRILAIAFLSNPDNKRTVNHIDGDKLNNSLSNLEWSTDSEQMFHAHSIGLNKGAKKIYPDMLKAIRIRFFNGENLTSISKDYPVCLASITTHFKKYANKEGFESEYLKELSRQKIHRNNKANEKRNY